MGTHEEILRCLAQEQVDFIVGGGVACVLHGVERVTMDVDLSIHLTKDNFTRFLSAVNKLGLIPRAPISPHVLLDSDAVDQLIREKHALVFSFIHLNDPFKQVDVFLTKGLSYESLLPDSNWMTLGNFNIRVIGKARLIQLKELVQPPRLKDMLDLETLKKDARKS